MRFEKSHRADVATHLVNPPATRIDRIPLQCRCTHRLGVFDAALEQSVHEAAPPEPGPNDETNNRPNAVVVNMWDRPGVDQSTVGGLGSDRAPSSDLTVDISKNARTRLALTQGAHVGDASGHVKAGVSVSHAHASKSTGVSRHHQRSKVSPTSRCRKNLDGHQPRIGDHSSQAANLETAHIGRYGIPNGAGRGRG